MASSPRLLLLFALLGLPAVAQPEWRSTLYPADWTPPNHLRFETDKLIQDFSYAGYRRGEVELPSVAGPVFAAEGFGADPTGVADSTAAIQAAIDAAAADGGGVVTLGEGTFKIAPRGSASYALRIAASRIVLRGAGRDRTFLLNDSTSMRGKHILRVEGSTSGWSSVPSGSPQPRLTADLLGPTTEIPVASTAGFVVGDWIVLRANATDAFAAEHAMTDLWAGQASGLGGVMFLRQITAIDAASSRITIDAPIRYYLKVRDDARIHRAVTHLEEVGVEDLSIGNRQHPEAASRNGWAEEDYSTEGSPSYDVHGSWAVAFLRVRHSWITRVSSFRPAGNTIDTHLLSNGVLLQNCRGVTVRDCEFQRPLYGGGGGNGYMYRLQASNECLVRDCIARYNRHGFVFSHMACSGNVILGGLAQVTRTQAAGTGTTSGEGCDHHMHLSQSNLIDGVQLDRDFFTAHYRGTSGTAPQHGQGGTHSVYWNLVGLAYHGTKNYIVRSEQARYGYVIGTRGAAAGISTSSGAPASRTAPLDHTEGAGQGRRLRPLSLYHDQLMRRLAREQAGPPSARIVNLATRALVGGSAGTPIAGFVLQGTAARRMLIRAVGPGLAAFGVPGTLADPALTLTIGGASAVRNDSWNAADSPVFAAAGAFPLPPGSRDAAIVQALAPAGYTTPVGDGGGQGIVLLEVYDVDSAATDSRLVNASTRAHVGRDAQVLIPGLVIQGSGVVQLLLRVAGPALASFGVPDPLADPEFTLFADRLPIAANDDWGASADAVDIAAAGRRLGAFDLPPQGRDAAVLVSLRAGTYTAHVSGVGGGTGTALVEVYLVR